MSKRCTLCYRIDCACPSREDDRKEEQKRRGPGRPKNPPGVPVKDGRAQVKFRAPEEVAAFIRGKPQGWLLALVEREMTKAL